VSIIDRRLDDRDRVLEVGSGPLKCGFVPRLKSSGVSGEADSAIGKAGGDGGEEGVEALAGMGGHRETLTPNLRHGGSSTSPGGRGAKIRLRMHDQGAVVRVRRQFVIWRSTVQDEFGVLPRVAGGGLNASTSMTSAGP